MKQKKPVSAPFALGRAFALDGIENREREEKTERNAIFAMFQRARKTPGKAGTFRWAERKEKPKFNMRNTVPLNGTKEVHNPEMWVVNCDNGQPHAEMLH